MPDISIRLLGTVGIDAGDGPIAPHAGRVSTLLALLGVEAGRVVSLDRIMQQLWGDAPPRSGRSTLYAYVSRLRGQLEPTAVRIVARTPGYVLEAPPGSIDVQVFGGLVARADERASAGDWPGVLESAGAALTLWRGTPFTDTIPCDDLANEAKRLERLAERARELSARALLALGRADEAVRRADELIARDRFNETYWRLHMRAEHAGGRTAAALADYDEFRRLMSDELGIDPSDRMRALHVEILRSAEEPARTAAPEPVPPPPVAAPVARPIGRIAERAARRRAGDAARAGAGRGVGGGGEAGGGKTRLAEYAADRARRVGAVTVWARAIDGAGTPPLWMWEQVLGRLRRRSDSGESGADTLRAFTDSEPPGGLAPEQARFRLYQRIVAEVLAVADHTPVLLVFDDAQWADDGSLQTLRLLAPALRERACTVVVTARPRVGSGTDLLAALARETTAERWWLEALDRDEVAAIVAESDRATERDSRPDEVENLWVRSAGNPFFLHELMRAGSGSAIPATIAEVFGQRLAALPADSRELLEIAAVAGRALDPLVLARASGVAVVEVVRRLDPVRAEGLVTSDQAARTLTFGHDLGREAILARLPAADAVTLHGRIADAIARVYADDLTAHLDELANHRYAASAGAPSNEAFEACMAAADHAASRLAYDQAALHRARALSVLVPGVDHRDVRFEVLVELTTERQLSGDVIGAVTSMRQALDLARLMDDAVLMRRAVAALGEVTVWNWRSFDQVDDRTVHLIESILATPDDVPMLRIPPAERASLLGALAVELYYSGDGERSLTLAREAVERARAHGDPVLLGRVLNNFAIATWFPRYADERRDRIDEALALADRGLPQTTELVALLHRAPLHLEQGQVDTFAGLIARARGLAARLGRPELEAQVGFQVTGMAALRGDHAEAADLLDRYVRQYSRTSLWGGDWTSIIVRTHLARAGGRLDEVADELIARASEDANRTLRLTVVLVLAQLGDAAQARALQHRWGLTAMPRRTHWGSSFEWAQAAEIALLLGTPSPVDAARVLATVDAPLVLVGTAAAVHGPIDVLRERLARELGDDRAADAHRRSARRIADAVERSLGVRPSWSWEVH